MGSQVNSFVKVRVMIGKLLLVLALAAVCMPRVEAWLCKTENGALQDPVVYISDLNKDSSWSDKDYDDFKKSVRKYLKGYTNIAETSKVFRDNVDTFFENWILTELKEVL